ncbi:FlaA1/EpsC-like NDP-sugar epimerase [Saccharomonospora amisosensis]|uniref:FlaA1/EpsC-like NDP-sugar epimerase n=1 Tax=Saccharomonospora amisosensis TaxID=1128677 RepID=A0A7X5USD6_9PSEU|nr:nucleoside-diphosphate sugar epimerase/dehydratase [Saccharomonospora amisosensis]NIJ13356.1 FlaA1/EpsC-like NDP-sugar epimerase [Saccharomonospora amisosensis]
MHDLVMAFSAPWRRKTALLAAVDGFSWLLAILLASWLRYEFTLDQVFGGALVRATAVAVLASWVTGWASRLYSGGYAVGSLDDVLNLAKSTILGGFALLIALLLGLTPSIPRSVPVIATLLALSMSASARLLARAYRGRRLRPRQSSARRVIVYGSGPQGEQLIRSMLSGAAGDLLPVAVLDDDTETPNARVAGVPVRGGTGQLEAVSRETRAQLLIVAMVNPDPAAMRSLVSAAANTSLDVKVLPPLSELLRPWADFSDLRDLNLTDLLGRAPVDTDVQSIAGYLAGQRVLITGAGGSIGSELCRQVDKFKPAALMMLDRDESALHAVRLSLYGKADLDSPNVILADIRDADRIREVFLRYQPDVVFHAAALKHLAMLERYPEEAWKTNVLGTITLLEAACESGVSKFINVSTDKAANPSSMLGRSKRIGERLVAGTAARCGGTFLSVRFGNVLGSRGSVLTTFAEQLSSGAPLTVTHPDVTRFFMTVPEAVELVIQAAAIGRSGEALVLDMGEPVRIAELAEMLMALSGRQSPIVYTGLGRGEKLHEELFGSGELDRRPVHPAISHIRVSGIDTATVRTVGSQLDVARAMTELVDSEVSIPRVREPQPVELRPAERSDSREQAHLTSNHHFDPGSSTPQRGHR